MKQLLVFASLLLACAGCAKKMVPVPDPVGAYKGVVIKNTCCLIAIHSVGANAIGQDWTDSMSTGYLRYDHAFKVANACQFGNHKQGDTINFNIIKPQPQNCACCMLYTTTPDTAYSIIVFK